MVDRMVVPSSRTVPITAEIGRQAKANGVLVKFDPNRMDEEIGEVVELIARLRGVKQVDSSIVAVTVVRS